MSIKSEKQFEVIIEKLDQLLEENKQLKTLIAQKDDELSLQKEQIEFLTQKLYGPKKETLKNDPNQGNLFNDRLFSEPEQTGDQSDEDEVIITTERRRKKRKGLKNQQLSSLPTVDYIHEIESCTCPTCQSAMKEVSTQLIRQEVRFIPARVENHRHFQKTYACANCEKSGTRTPFAKAEIPRFPLNNTAASASLIAETMYQKFEQKVPGYRQEAYWNLLGYPIPRHTIANWHIKTSQYYLEALVAVMRQELLNQKVLHADETTFKVLNDKDRQKSYMWLFSTGKYSERAIYIYKLGPSRSGSVPRDFLEEYTGYLHSDGFSGYNNLPEMTMIACLAHIRRKFYDARPKNYSSKSVAHKGVTLCNELFALDKSLKDLTVSERYDQRLKLLRPKLEAFFDWCESLTAHGKLGTAINYALNQKERMMNVLEDGRLVLSNNLAERGIKSLVMGRKNWLFSKSFDGAHAVATILSLVETAKSNGLHPRKYLDYLLTHLPNLYFARIESIKVQKLYP
ncbi:IS66 family transposase [Marinilactibacillus sp. Marseille-P9653]|uniref:IS66 family transposase n=1 Tax=Marinilactibacillus sp. Marseille-P9653 TaxID=2866583 RepID=UPI001CE4A2FB|nr:IS66 family transposase [Marinilactibacillus sp. Marseille-P9653]